MNDHLNETGVSYIDRAVALLLIVLLSPVFLFVYLLVFVTMGGPVFYVGERLGQHKKTFNIIKFRTLPIGAQKRIGGELFNHKHESIPAVAQFLRDTRLDELPQLVNILRGEMVFFGPRPERYEVYVKQCASIPGYEARFQVPPGVIGVSQLCTPHSAPKTMRAKIDRRYVSSSSSSNIGFGIYAVWVLARRLTVQFAYHFWRERIKNQLLNKRSERRTEPRIKQHGATIEFLDQDKSTVIADGYLLDINHEFIRVKGRIPFKADEKYLCRLTSQSKKSLRGRTKSAYCYCTLLKNEDSSKDKIGEYIVKYEAVSPLNKYLIDQYFLYKAIIACPN
ncbi:sugar transferase [Pontibacterium granulatum]|uniref:sugar transferase n=1 Tax=Pontibacterium granulatum TaxID=2036029 RepID=UPI00249AC458|nr:sugar transferase [Pontibacterium granulatum]MDI3325749.1 sugar transferase [Pontibacterium granulatum]